MQISFFWKDLLHRTEEKKVEEHLENDFLPNVCINLSRNKSLSGRFTIRWWIFFRIWAELRVILGGWRRLSSQVDEVKKFLLCKREVITFNVETVNRPRHMTCQKFFLLLKSEDEKNYSKLFLFSFSSWKLLSFFHFASKLIKKETFKGLVSVVFSLKRSSHDS